jgi:uncharacterized protein (TIGR02001 family)
MKKLLCSSLLCAAAALPPAVHAQAAAPAAAPAPDWTFSGNLGLFSDYRFRGMSQTDYGPALQGGFDIAHSSGFYVGNWNSNVEQKLYNGASLEMDFYGGYKGSVGDFSYDLGAIYYYYPKTGAGGLPKIDNTELYVGGGFGPVTAKYYHAVSDFFGIPGTKNSYYIDLAASFPLGNGFGLNAHVGYQKVKGLPSGSIDNNTDYKVGVTYDLSGWVFGLAYVGNSEKEFAFTGNSIYDYAAGLRAAPEGAGKGSVVASVSKSF